MIEIEAETEIQVLQGEAAASDASSRGALQPETSRHG